MRGRYRLSGHNYGSGAWYFVTVVAAGREHVFGQVVGTDLLPSPLGKIVEEEIAVLVQRRSEIKIPVASVLPNHVHLLIGIGEDPKPWDGQPRRFEAPASGTLGSVVALWKAGISRRARREAGWPDREIWQRRFHDRVVRDVEEWEAIADYILFNPVNWHLDPLSDSREPSEEELRDWKTRHGFLLPR